MIGESSVLEERAVPRERTDVTERAVELKRTVIRERADMSERTVLRERTFCSRCSCEADTAELRDAYAWYLWYAEGMCQRCQDRREA